MTAKKWAGAKFSIGTNSASLASESSWTVIGQVQTVSGQLSGKWKTANSSTYDDSYDTSAKTTREPGNLDLTYLMKIADTGQVALAAAVEDKTDAPYNFKVELDDKPNADADSKPTTIKFQAHALGDELVAGARDGLVMKRCSLDVQGARTEADLVDGTV